ncbi:MAG: hypothetical protein N3E51_00720 [Candidatus Micrarchaeota archaeon]|nr:hypothetical protein [Candidatus Micrarchaeota archaeon]
MKQSEAGKMRRNSAVFLACLIALSCTLFSEEPPPFPSSEGVIFGTAVLSSGAPASKMPIIVLARTGTTESVHRLITDNSGRFVLSLESGRHELDAVLLGQSSAVAYAATAEADSRKETNATLVFYPAGSASGVVAFEGMPVPGAKVKVACLSSGFDYERANGGSSALAGEAGEFAFKVLPEGTCQFSASTDSLAGNAEAQIRREKTTSVYLEMRKKAGQDFLPYLVAVLAAVVLGAIVLKSGGKKEEPRSSGLLPERKPRQEHAARFSASLPAPEGRSPDPLSNQKVKAVLATLSEREQQIVKFLFKSGGRAKRSQIQHKLLIPKTSLLRNLRLLERKRIVKLTPFGRNLLAEIEDWLQK